MNRSTSLVVGAVALLVALTSGAARASFVSAVPDPFLNADLVTGGPRLADPTLGYVAYSVTNIVKTGSTFTPTDGLTLTYSATPVLTFYATATSTAPLGSTTLTGQFTVQIPGASEPLFPNAVYDLRLLSSTATGTVNGLPVSVRLIASLLSSSVGETQISTGPGSGYTIDTSLTQYSEFSLAGAPYTALPPIQSGGVPAVPEPSSLALLGLMAIAGVRRRRR